MLIAFTLRSIIDKHMQRVLLWGFQTKLGRSAQDVDRELDWLVSHEAIQHIQNHYPLVSLNIFSYEINKL